MSEFISQDKIAELVGSTRPTVRKWLNQPEIMPIGAYMKLQALGIDIKTQEWLVQTCAFCDGKGFNLTPEARINNNKTIQSYSSTGGNDKSTFYSSQRHIDG